MNNETVGKIGAAVTGSSVFAFAISMLVSLSTDADFASYCSSLFIAIGFVPFMCALVGKNPHPSTRAIGLCGIAFAAIYAVIVCLVYYAQCTTLRLNPALSEEALSILSFGHLGSLFFNYDLLGYAFMGLSTFLVSFTVEPRTKPERIFKRLLCLHGVFFLPCLIVPLFPVFTADTGDLFGTILLEFWCLYFLPVCVLGFSYVRKPSASSIR